LQTEQTISITVNGESRQLARGAKVVELLAQLGLAPQRLAVELNLSMLPRAQWSEAVLQEGDRLEIVHFVGGG
jgi:thiazole synthase